MLKQIEIDLQKFMSEEKFQTEKNKAMASGGPIDKFDLKLS